jgi:malonyl-ACP O-methyltransferase BioC
MDKNLIKQRFSNNLKKYNENAKIQKQMAEKLISFLTDNKYDSILELGCGTGLLTQLANDNLWYKKYTAIDIVPDCQKYINKINSNIEFIADDVEEFIKSDDKKYDLIISNASMQWLENLPQFVEQLIQKLNTNGKLVFSTFGKENFREIYFVLGKTLKYYSLSELKTIFKEYSPIIEEEVRIIAFKTPKDVLKHIKNTGVNAISSENWTKKDLVSFEKEYNVLCANRPTLTYNPMYILINIK